jgi:nucleotide-binding universal stress UspA family protein
MTLSTLMVRMDLQASNDAVLEAAAELAGRFKADVVGIAACHPMQIIYSDGYVQGDLLEQDRTQKEDLIRQAEARFRAALGNRVPNLHWRSSVCYAPLPGYIADNMRSADLLLTGPAPRGSMFDSSQQLDLGELVMRLGRPALLVPPGTERLDLDSVLVGWRDTRETRRAVVDALPLLRLAGRVTVAEVAPDEGMADAQARLADVAAWLGRHGIAAHPVAVPSAGDDAGRLEELALDHQAGLVVVGAYGHTRLREWVLGGVTRSLLAHPSRPVMLSH